MRIGILGTGVMGRGIAEYCLQKNCQVIMYNPKNTSLQNVMKSIEANLEKLLSKSKISGGQKKSYLESLNTSSDINDLHEVDIIIEAVIEDITVKSKVWNKVTLIANDSMLLATNTSSLSVKQLSHITQREEQFCGLHFFNPVHAMSLVEVVKTEFVSNETLKKAIDFVLLLEKVPIECYDKPGFIVNRLLIPYINHAASLWNGEQADAHNIDEAMKLGANMPIGPLALADLIGLDVVKAISDSLYANYEDSRYLVADQILESIEKGDLGKKTKTGFFKY